MTPSPSTTDPAAGPPQDKGGDYWYALIDEEAAGDFLGLTPRTMQAKRQRGDGPRFVRLSSRCIRYRRTDLRAWSEARLRNSTSDDGQEAA